MAKISARGAHKVASAHKTETREYSVGGCTYVKTRLALRSDGSVLRAIDVASERELREYKSRGWSRGGYSIIGSIASTPAAERRARFERYATQRGFEMSA